MNKISKTLTVAALSTVTALSLCACSSAKTADLPITPHIDNMSENGEVTKIEIIVNDGNTDKYEVPPVSGVRRRFSMDKSGVYTVEYVHTPYGMDRDDTLDYTLEIKADNTYTLNVVADGVRSDHYGHWYSRRGGSITFFYDEEIDPTAHNYYVSDSLYGEMVDGGKIMIYDNGKTIVLAKSAPESQPYQA